MAVRQELMPSCELELRELIGVIGGRTDLTTMHERYMHECNVHDDFTSCEAAKSVLESLVNRDILDRTIRDFTSCMNAQLRRSTL